jgi:hypothetical protein
VLSPCLPLEPLEIPGERHAFLVVVEKARDLGRGRAVGAQKLRLLVESR